MACIDPPKLPTPSLSGFSIPKIPVITPPTQLNASGLIPCCKVTIPIPNPLDFLPALPPIPPFLPSALLTALDAAISTVNSFIDSIPLDCPLSSTGS